MKREQFQFETLSPAEIESCSMSIIESELAHEIDERLAPTIKRVVHTTADFDYVDQLAFSENVIEHALKVFESGCHIVTDTNMAKAGINKAMLEKLGIRISCFMADEDVAQEAKKRGVTRAIVSMEKAAAIKEPLVLVIGNAPTALIRIYDLIQENKMKPELIVGVPVGFVNVVEAKELIMQAGIPYIVARGRKGGSNVAAAIINSILYQLK